PLGARPPDGWRKGARCLPTGGDLAEHFGKEVSLPPELRRELPIVAQFYSASAAGRGELELQLREIFDIDYPLCSLHKYLAAQKVPLLIVTTNYDDLIERALAGAKPPHPYNLVVHPTDEDSGDT